jgi:hypothetical protein
MMVEYMAACLGHSGNTAGVSFDLGKDTVMGLVLLVEGQDIMGISTFY